MPSAAWPARASRFPSSAAAACPAVGRPGSAPSRGARSALLDPEQLPGKDRTTGEERGGRGYCLLGTPPTPAAAAAGRRGSCSYLSGIYGVARSLPRVSPYRRASAFLPVLSPEPVTEKGDFTRMASFRGPVLRGGEAEPSDTL